MKESELEHERSAHVVGVLHSRLVFGRRTSVLSGHLASMIPQGSRVLDVGCGDGTIDSLIQQQRRDVCIQGIDVFVRPKTTIQVDTFDGTRIPYADRSFDVVMLIDVLHHTSDPRVLMREAARVGRQFLIKDHLREGFLARSTLRLMDWVGNAHHGVALPYNYLRESEWRNAFGSCGVEVMQIKMKLSLYPVPLSWFFERRLHFIAQCRSKPNL